jgi:(p)ppGpp synthase/HD superfamily hydrolase
MTKDLPAVALALATKAHNGQVDKQGRDYLTHHLIPIAEMLRPFGESAYMAGILHDILEDTRTTVADLRAAGIPEVVIDAVISVTRIDGETYDALIDRAAAHFLGCLVKLVDNWKNLTENENLARTDPTSAARLRIRYEGARVTLERRLAERAGG